MSHFASDLVERVTRTFIATFLMTYIAGIGPLGDTAVLADLANADLLQRAAVAALMAVGTLILGFATKPFGSPDTASVLPPESAAGGDDSDLF